MTNDFGKQIKEAKLKENILQYDIIMIRQVYLHLDNLAECAFSVTRKPIRNQK